MSDGPAAGEGGRAVGGRGVAAQERLKSRVVEPRRTFPTL